MNNENKPVLSRTSEMKIGKVTYIVKSHYKPDGRETAEQKFLRFVSDRVAAEINKPGNIAVSVI
jgi:hypothetical protein